jgi:transposase-like protein
MPSNNSKYSGDIRERTAKHIIESGKSATSISEELGIDKNTVCRWVRDYRRKNHMPSYEESKGIKRVTNSREKESNKQLKERDRRIRNLEEEVDILKKSLRIFMQPL